jgi:outer membrane biosynthesis protein TonB
VLTRFRAGSHPFSTGHSRYFLGVSLDPRSAAEGRIRGKCARIGDSLHWILLCGPIKLQHIAVDGQHSSSTTYSQRDVGLRPEPVMATAHSNFDPVARNYLIQGHGFSLHVNPAVLVRLDALVREGFQLLPKGGLEIGGLLLGSARSSELWLDEIEAVRIEYRSGPSYQLSEADVETFRKIISNAGRRSEARVIGHYRSHARGEIAITSADLTIARLAEGPVHFMLLIKGTRFEAGFARLFRRRGEDHVELLQFPLKFDPTKALSAAAQPAEQKPAGMIQPGVTPDLPVEEMRVAISYPHVGSSNQAEQMLASIVEPRADSTSAEATKPAAQVEPRSRWTAALIVALAICTALAVLAALHSRRIPAPAAELGLEIRRTDQLVTVSWNHSSPAVLQALSGVLTIQDGNSQRQIRFDASQLRASNVVYVPQSPSVQFRLEVFRAGDHFSGETVATDTGLPPTATEEAAKMELANKIIVSRPDAQAEAEHARTQPSSAPVQTPNPLAREQTRPRPFRPVEKPAAPKLAPATLPQPPVVHGSELRPVVVPPTILEPPRIAAPKEPVTAPTSPAQQAAPGSTAVSYSEPVAVRKILPPFPANLRFAIRGRVSVEVKFAINAAGQVVGATPVNPSTPPQKLLAPIAAQAAMRWQFEPARRNGQPVDSETVVTFNFEPAGR